MAKQTLEQLRRNDPSKKWLKTQESRKNPNLSGAKLAELHKDHEKLTGFSVQDYKAKVTEPGQSKSIGEMLDRYEKGRPLPTE
jgi:hypothetical protein